MKQRLTAPLVDKLEPRAKAYFISDTEVQGLNIRVEPSGAKTYYLRYRNDTGKRRALKLGVHGPLKPLTARELAYKMLSEVAHGKDPSGSRQKKKSGTDTLGGYIDKVYSPWVQSHQKSGALTVNMINSAFTGMLPKPLSELSPFLFEKWRKSRLDRGNKPVATNRYIAALRGALTKAVEWGYLESNPLTGVKSLGIDKRTVDRYLDSDEQERLYNALHERDERIRSERRSANDWRKKRGYKAFSELDDVGYADHLEPMITISLNTGLRRGELFSLNWTEVNFNKRTLSVTSSSSKTGEVRHIPINKTVFDVLTKWGMQTDTIGLVFCSKNGKKFTHVNSAWRKLLVMAGIQDFRWHDMRHHFASQLVMNGIDLNTVRELLGHSDIKMTLRYAHLAPEHKMKAVETLSRDIQSGTIEGNQQKVFRIEA